MTNQLLAKVLFTNGIATKDQIQAHWDKASDSKDIAAVLRDAGLMTPEVYKQVMSFVARMEASTPAPTPEPPPTMQQAPSVAAPPPAPVTPFGAKPSLAGRAERPSIRIPTPSESLASTAAAAAPAFSPDSAFSIEGNNSFVENGEEEPVEEVAAIEGLQDTRLFGFAPTAVAATPTVVEEDEEELFSKPWVLPTHDWVCEPGDGSAKTVATMAPGPQSRLDGLLLHARKNNLSELHVVTGSPLWAREGKVLKMLGDQPCPSPEVRRLLAEAISLATAGFAFDRRENLLVSLSVPGAGRFRMAVTWTSEGPALAFKVIPLKVPSWNEFSLPDVCKAWIELRQGLVLIGGSSGSGRSTTARSLAEKLQEKRGCMVQVVAEPIEAVWPNGCTVQFEPKLHGLTRMQALREAMDRGEGVLVCDDVRGAEELELLLEACENGMLVIAVMNAMDAVDLLERFLGAFPEQGLPRLRQLLARSLQGVLCQRLLPSASGEGAVVAFEALHVNSSVTSLVRKGEISGIPAMMAGQKGLSLLLDDSLRKLVDDGKVQGMEAWARAVNPSRFAQYRPDSRKGGV